MTKKHLDDKLKIVYDELFETAADLILRYENSQIVASTLMAQAIRLYRTILTDKEFEEMLEIVIKSAKEVKPFIFHKLH
jgi:hypothetical protein